MACGQPQHVKITGFRLHKRDDSRANYVVRRCLSLILIAVALGAAGYRADAFDTAYWVWQREDPLTETELAELAAQQVHKLYWHVGELENVGETWHWKQRFTFPALQKSQIDCVPVVRLVSREHQPFSAESVASLLTALSPIAKLGDELQLDY